MGRTRRLNDQHLVRRMPSEELAEPNQVLNKPARLFICGQGPLRCPQKKLELVEGQHEQRMTRAMTDHNPIWD